MTEPSDPMSPRTAAHPCLSMIVVTPCSAPNACVVVRCGNCGTDAHFEELSLAELNGYVEEHCAAGGDYAV